MPLTLGYLYLLWAYILWRAGAPLRIIFPIVLSAVGMFVVATLEASGIKVP